MVTKIYRNAVRCRLCGEEIESTDRHGYVRCRCGNVAVDGGFSYLRRTFREGRDSYEELSEYETDDGGTVTK